jgi:hypothetical protein
VARNLVPAQTAEAPYIKDAAIPRPVIKGQDMNEGGKLSERLETLQGHLTIEDTSCGNKCDRLTSQRRYILLNQICTGWHEDTSYVRRQ